MNIELYNPKLNWHIMPDNDEYINVLREQGVSKFNPIEYYKETLYQKSEKKVIKRSKKAQKIIDDNIKEKNEELKKSEEENKVKQWEEEKQVNKIKEEQVEEINTEEIEKQKTLYNSLYVLKQKFPENTENIHIDPDMSYETLNQKKDLFFRHYVLSRL